MAAIRVAGVRSVRSDPCGAVRCTAPQGSLPTPATRIAAQHRV